MYKKGLAPIIIVVIIALLVAGGVGSYTYIKNKTTPVACTMDAKLCPDGSVVGRIPPNCEFTECPSTTSTKKQDINKKGIVSLPLSVPISVPDTSACAITSPPPSMVGINTHTEVYGQDADPNMITLGPKLGINPEKPGYATKHSMAWELKIHGTPVLAPIDMVLVGFQNNSAEYGIGADGRRYTPFNDLVLFFESASPDWPGMIIYVYHLYSSPLLLGQNINQDCGDVEVGTGIIQAQGHLYMGNMDYVTDKGNAGACEALIGYTVKRGELIGFAGSVGTHSFVDIGFKVSDTSENPLFGLNSKGIDPSIAQTGNRYLHWVQPGLFFYWKCYSSDANFPSGVLAYPFECDGYQLPAEQHDVNFKYK